MRWALEAGLEEKTIGSAKLLGPHEQPAPSLLAQASNEVGVELVKEDFFGWDSSEDETTTIPGYSKGLTSGCANSASAPSKPSPSAVAIPGSARAAGALDGSFDGSLGASADRGSSAAVGTSTGCSTSLERAGAGGSLASRSASPTSSSAKTPRFGSGGGPRARSQAQAAPSKSASTKRPSRTLETTCAASMRTEAFWESSQWSTVRTPRPPEGRRIAEPRTRRPFGNAPCERQVGRRGLSANRRKAACEAGDAPAATASSTMVDLEAPAPSDAVWGGAELPHGRKPAPPLMRPMSGRKRPSGGGWAARAAAAASP